MVKRPGLRFQWVVALAASSLLAQGPIMPIAPRAANIDTRPTPHMRVDSNLVLVPVLVTDTSGQLVLGLEKENFRVFDDKVEQTISHFAVEDAPISVVLVFDTSRSMGKKLQMSREAVCEFLKASNPEDEFALVEFATSPRLTAQFTRDPAYIESRLAFLAAEGRTALIDAVLLALRQMRFAQHTRKVILVISDGGDNSSRFSRRELKNQIRESDVQIYSIGILNSGMQRGTTMEELDGPDLLHEIARQTGGRLFEVENLNHLAGIAKQIGAALRNQYLLGYSPSSQTKDGSIHRILVEVPKGTSQTKLRTSFRSSYRAPTQ
jgi:VWFA-related protein